MVKKKQKVVLPPELPPDVPEEQIEVSDEDLQFVNDNAAYAGFVSNLDTRSITKHVSRVADAKEGDLELLYEKRVKRKMEIQEKEESAMEVDPVDVLPVKWPDGTLHYKPVVKRAKKGEEAPQEEESTGVVKLSKSEKRAKFKKARKEAKKQSKEEVVQQTPQAEALDEVKKDLTAEEAKEGKKYKLAELGTSLLADPESNIRSIKEMLEISKDGDTDIVILGLKSLLAVFKDIIPGFRIRLPTEKEQEMKVSKAVKKTRFYESTLLSAYKAYVQKLISLQEQIVYKRVAVRCICMLLAAVPHFNFRDILLVAVVQNIGSQDDFIRKLCCSTIKSLFSEEGKHSGEVTVEAARLIAEVVKVYNCQLHPDSIEVFLSLSFDEDLGKQRRSEVENRTKNKKSKKRKGKEEPNDVPDNERKQSRKEMMSKTREEVDADFNAASYAQDPHERRRMQSQTLSFVFGTYFRILKHAVYSISSANVDATISYEGHPLLAPCLNGIGKFSHLIDLDFMADLMNCLRKLAGNGGMAGSSFEKIPGQLTVSERLRCCIVAFKVMRSNLDALNVDLQEFYVVLYNLILEYRQGRIQHVPCAWYGELGWLLQATKGERIKAKLLKMAVAEAVYFIWRARNHNLFTGTYIPPAVAVGRDVIHVIAARDQGEVLAEAFKIMLCDDRQHDTQRAAAFVKRLATFSVCFGSAESMAALVTIRHLLQKNVKCRNLLENDAGGGSVAGSIARYQPNAIDPNLSGALASVLWELNLLTKHYHPVISSLASTISTMLLNSNNQVVHAHVSPQQAYQDFLQKSESFAPSMDLKKAKNKKRGNDHAPLIVGSDLDSKHEADENEVRKKLSEHFLVLRDIEENKRLRSEFDETTLSLKLYEEYKQQKKRKKEVKGT